MSPEKTAIRKLLADAKVQKALAWLKDDQERKIAELKEMVIVSGAPHTEPEVRSPMFLEKLRGCGLTDCSMDEVGNVFGCLKGSEEHRILVESHLDTVFGKEVPLVLAEDSDGILRCPGISDNTASMATELSVIRAIQAAGLRPVKDIVFCGTVGEEAPGEARGVRHIMKTCKNLDAYICLDSGHDFDIITGAVSCIRGEYSISGPGGHSWNDWGRPSPINAAGRAISAIAQIIPDEKCKTTYNIGLVSGGTSVNSIATRAVFHVDVRSLDNSAKIRLFEHISQCVRDAVEEENRAHAGHDPLGLSVRTYGDKPGGLVPDDSPAVRAAMLSAELIGLPRKICPPASTNANFPISAGIPSMTVNCNGRCGNMHATAEWYDPAGSWKGAQALLLLLFAMAGLEGVSAPLGR